MCRRQSSAGRAGWSSAGTGGTIGAMKHRDPERHPDVFRFMQVDAELTGVLIALGFVVMGFVSGVPIAKWFLLGALLLGGGVAVLLRITRKSN
jgi:hypothetical protein